MRKSALLLLWSLLGFHSAFAGEIPESLHISNGNTPYPGWVVAEKVLTSSGEVDPALFTPADRSIISGYLKLPARDGCIRLGQEQDPEETRVGTQKNLGRDLGSTVRHAGWVFSASVVAKAMGFSGSTPGTLLEVLPEETFKGPRERGGAHYVFIPIGTISLIYYSWKTSQPATIFAGARGGLGVARQPAFRRYRLGYAFREPKKASGNVRKRSDA